MIEARPDLRPRLEGLQFRIDAERQLARTPLKACLKVSSLMWESFNTLKDRFDELAGMGSKPSGTTTISHTPATVIPLRRTDAPDDKSI